MNASLEGNQSGSGGPRPFCLLAAGSPASLDLCLPEALVVVLLTALIIAGNVLVLLVFRCAPLLHPHGASAFVRTMACADLLVGLSCLVPSAALLLRARPPALPEALLCKAFGYAVSVLKSVSMSSLACIGLDRYLAVTRPLSYPALVTPCRLRACVLLVWLYSAAVFLPAFFDWGKPGYHGDVFRWCAEAWQTRAAFTLFIVAVLYAPAALVVCFTYARIFRICRQHTREISERQERFGARGGGAGGPAEGQPCPDRRYALVLLRITSVFYLLWLPYIAYFLLESSALYRSQAASFLTTWLAISNSFCNCLIYSLSNSVFRKGLRRLSGAACACCRRPRDPPATTASRGKRPPDGAQV